MRKRYSVAVSLGALIIGASVMLTSQAASAVTQGGYVFNDSWALSAPGSAKTTTTPSAYTATAATTATSSLPTSHGPIGITATFAPDPRDIAGTSFLTNAGYTQAKSGGGSTMFVGAPTPSALPGLGLLTNASYCGGPVGSRAHQDFTGACDTGVLTLSFARPVTNPILDISGLGGFAALETVDTNSDPAGQVALGSMISTRFTITNPYATFAPTAGATNLALTNGNRSLQIASQSTNNVCNSTTKGWDAPATFAQPDLSTAGCGSVVIAGTFDSLNLNIATTVAPYSSFPSATFHTGTDYVKAVAPGDGVNGYNTVFNETTPITAITGSHSVSSNDLSIVSIRLPDDPIVGATASIGDEVFVDVDRDGKNTPGTDAPLAGATVALQMMNDGAWTPALDSADAAIPAQITAADGKYLFTGLNPGRTYRVGFSIPADDSYTAVGSTATQNAGNAIANDSNAITEPVATDAFSAPITLTAGESNLTIDAGVVTPTPAPTATTKLAFTGSTLPVWPTLTAGGLALAAGAILVTAARRRTRKRIA